MPVTIDKIEYSSNALARAAYANSAKLIVGFDETDAAFMDSSDYAQAITNNDVLYNASGVFGGCGEFNGTSSYLRIPAGARFNLGSVFELGGRAYLGETTGSNLRMLCGYGGGAGSWSATNGHMYLFYIDTDAKLTVQYNTGGSYGLLKSTNPVNLSSGFHDVKFVNDATHFTMFVDGNIVYQGSPISIYNISSPSYFYIGTFTDVSLFWKGFIDDFYILTAPLHTDTYTPPTSPLKSIISTESTIKKVGSYSLKWVAGSINQTITKTCSPTLNLTDQDTIKLWVRASRTGTNFKIGFHDSGGTTTESNIAISSADTFEEKEIDISAVANANKDAIDSIAYTVIDATEENTIYLDWMMAYAEGEILDPKYVYSSQTQLDGTVGTLNASTIASAKGSGSNLSADILKSGEVVDDITGTLSGGGGVSRARIVNGV